ncbi:lymphatic vessel endothelial hyaluronic receptor 1b isoform X2 [Silurus meridionalis]|uniref:lymphatic vessel endothelial hyaluronic receptor 1b isoform X2 n=1 Tax=Silurus meridionalis TaxID=175797 RepID=UPI001EEB8464|nr:lymphatic vessel endothelial hyaluronic receptor 1b isoform X2 [Silurus meridionalis]
MISRSRVCAAFLHFVLCTASLDLSQIQVYPENGGISEVFIVQLINQSYSFNATTAIDVCTSLGVRIASRAEVETAYRNGLQTCRYGWVMEKVAIIPRIQQNKKCGQNRFGVIVWRASPTQLFDVFCSRSTGQTQATTSTTLNMTTVSDGRTDAKTTSPTFFPSTWLNKNLLGSSLSPQPISHGPNTSLIPTTSSFTVTPKAAKSSQTWPPSNTLPNTIYQPSISSTFSTSFSSFSTSVSSLSTSFSSFSTSFSILSSSHPFINSSFVTISSNETDVQPPPGKGFSFGVLLACVILAVMLLIIAGTGIIWYIKTKRPQRLSPWERICHKDMFETEMWKHDEQHFTMQNDHRNLGDDTPFQMDDDTISF